MQAAHEAWLLQGAAPQVGMVPGRSNLRLVCLWGLRGERKQFRLRGDVLAGVQRGEEHLVGGHPSLTTTWDNKTYAFWSHWSYDSLLQQIFKSGREKIRQDARLMQGIPYIELRFHHIIYASRVHLRVHTKPRRK